MREIAVALLLAWSSAAAAEPREPAQNANCTTAIATAERSSDIPAGLLAAIARVESGRPDPAGGAAEPWPWTIDAGGEGRFFATKAEAIAATTALQQEDVASIDVGCLQVNLVYHPAAFASLEEAFDPLANAFYAARFLRELFSQTGDWPAAVAAYHSQTYEIGAAYKGKVLAVWASPEQIGPPSDSPPRGTKASFTGSEALSFRSWPDVFRPSTWIPGSPPGLTVTARSELNPGAGMTMGRARTNSSAKRSDLADWVGAGLRDRDRWSAALESKSAPQRPITPSSPPPWVERVMAAVGGCAIPARTPSPSRAVPAEVAAVWKASAGNCPASPFAKPAALRHLLAGAWSNQIGR
jgi:hypothetical protein